ncbi:MAG: Ppx/GppA family phosphatase [Deltaproteobacteria bacterium]|nr:Ppx/GppA family phosphatase [Deltaproteobacteria bacterium]
MPPKNRNKIAAIDIGSNTVLLTIVQRLNNGLCKVLLDQAEIPRLAKNLKPRKNFDPKAKARAFLVLKKYKKICDQYQVNKVLAVGTAAFRKAKDGYLFAKQIFDELKIPVEIISGEEEARLSYLSAKQDFAKHGVKIGMIDIGGGSTEIVSERHGQLKKISLPIGSVSLTEKFIHRHPISDLEWNQLKNFIDESIMDPGAKPGMTLVFRQRQTRAKRKWVGVAATVTSLLAVLKKMKTYDPKKIHGKTLTLQQIEKLTEALRKLSLADRKCFPGMHPKRADVLPTGGLILSRLMRYLKFKKITVSNHGLRYGVLFEIHPR